MKKALSFVLALVLVLSICSAFTLAVSAEEGIAISHHNRYNWKTFEAMIITGADQTANEVLAAVPQTADFSGAWAMYKVEKIDGKYKATAFATAQADLDAAKAPANGFLLFVHESNAGYAVASTGAWLNKELTLSDETAILGELYAIDTVVGQAPKGYINVVADSGSDTPATGTAPIISAGKPYTLIGTHDFTGDGVVDYPDTDNKELTDGLKAAEASYYDEAWVGLSALNAEAKKDDKSVSVTLDLGEKKEYTKFVISLLSLNADGIYAPSAVTVLVSDDGETWSEPVALDYDTEPAAGIIVTASADSEGSARYIKFKCKRHDKGAGIFIDEVEVYGKAAAAPAPTPDDDSSQGGNQGGTTTLVPTVISGGKTYTASAATRNDQYDDDGARLTDGVIEVVSGGECAGWAGIPVEIVVDLGEAKDTNTYNLYYACGNWGIGKLGSAKMFTSVDGETYTEVTGLTDTLYAGDDSEGTWSVHKVSFTSEEAINARYVKFVADSGDSHVWLSEVEVIANVAASTPITGDAGIYAIAGLALVALIGTAVVIKKRA